VIHKKYTTTGRRRIECKGLSISHSGCYEVMRGGRGGVRRSIRSKRGAGGHMRAFITNCCFVNQIRHLYQVCKIMLLHLGLGMIIFGELIIL
jgi:hypothetical protein